MLKWTAPDLYSFDTPTKPSYLSIPHPLSRSYANHSIMTDANSSEPSWLQPSPVTLNSDDDDPTAPPKSKEDKKAQLDANSFKPSWATEEEDQGDERKGLLKVSGGVAKFVCGSGRQWGSGCGSGWVGVW